jgi:hypothetical protein
MMITLMNSLGVVLALALLFAFVWGAWRHTVEQTLGCSHLTDLSSGTKVKRYFTLLGKVLWNIAVLIVMVGAILLKFISLKGNDDGKQETKIDSNGNYWYRNKGGSWYTFSPDEDASEPWY